MKNTFLCHFLPFSMLLFDTMFLTEFDDKRSSQCDFERVFRCWSLFLSKSIFCFMLSLICCIDFKFLTFSFIKSRFGGPSVNKKLKWNSVSVSFNRNPMKLMNSLYYRLIFHCVRLPNLWHYMCVSKHIICYMTNKRIHIGLLILKKKNLLGLGNIPLNDCIFLFYDRQLSPTFIISSFVKI